MNITAITPVAPSPVAPPATTTPGPQIVVDHDGAPISATCMSRACFPDDPNHQHLVWPSPVPGPAEVPQP